MADTKITSLQTPQVTTNPATDVLPIVNIADTSMATSGSTRKITVNQLLGSGGTATLASATITGDLTVDTSTLKVDSTNNRVGVLNTPTVPLEVTGLIAASSGVYQAGGSNGIFAALNNDGTNPGLDLRRWTGTSSNHGAAYIATSVLGDALFYTDTVASNTKATSLRMTLNSTGLGIGVTPSVRLHASASAPTRGIVSKVQNSSSGTTGAYLAIAAVGANVWSLGLPAGSADLAIFSGRDESADGTERLRIDSSGNVGIGVTPSAWSGYKVLDIVGGGGITALSNGLYLTSNAYDNSGWKYKANGFATLDLSVSGERRFYTAPSGTAGNAITFTQAMTLDASGNLLVGRTSVAGSERLSVEKDVANNEIVRFIATNTSNPYGLAIQYNANISTAANEFAAYYVNGTTIRFGFRSNGGLANYQSNDVNLSDARTKTDINPLDSYWSKIKSLELVKFKYKDQSHSDYNIGLIAQQVESVAPEFVSNEGFGKLPEDGVPLKTIYTTDLYHAAIKALQEAMTRIEALEAKLA